MNSFPLQTYCCSKASICQATGNAMLKIWVCFFLSIFLQNKERVLKNGLFALLEESNAIVSTLYHRNCLPFKSNKNRNFKILYLNRQAEFRDQTNFLRKIIQFSLKQHGSLQLLPRQIDGRSLCPLKPYCCSKAFKTQRTENTTVKFQAQFFCLFCFKMKRDF